ncbi:hypothetical protein BO78DRAFT_308363, partial [Aspergillus sclerotiicarbonarius CBS 121057]
KATFETDLEALKRKGTLVVYGTASGMPELKISQLTPKNLNLLKPTVMGYLCTRREVERYAEELFGLLIRGRVSIRVHKEYQLQEARQAQKDLGSRKTSGKLLLKL